MALPLNITQPYQVQDQTAGMQVQEESTKPKTIDSEPKIDPAIKKRNDEFRQRIDICKLYRRKLIANWTVSIDYRRGKPFASQTDEDQVAVPLDWSLTKAKQALLFSQVPQVRVNHPPQTVAAGPWLKTFEGRLNDNLVSAGIESAMDECLPDCINAAGIGAVVVAYERITEDVELPSSDPVTHGIDTGTTHVPREVDHRYVIQRISPSDLLWPINFTGSDFDNASWIGRSGRITWADAVQKYKLKDSDKESILGEDRPMMDKLTHDVEKDRVAADEMVGFDEIFYKEFQYNQDAKSFSSIHHLVFVQGKNDPVLDEQWTGQHIEQDGSTIVGARRYPIQCLTLAYITDETIPPSDSAIGRSQVNEINKARTQMIRQRERSLPVRWFDVNRIDPTIQASLMRGTWQAMIPVQGEGSRVMGEVTRAQMPQENFMFDKIAKSDLNETWTVGMGVDPTSISSDKPDQPTPLIQAREGRERAKVVSFVTRIAEVLGGLMCLYEDPSTFGQGFDPQFSKILCYSILADSTILLDANQRLARINKFINDYAKSGWVNIEPVLKEAATLAGLDPNTVIKAPEPKPPVEPNISLRLTGVEDMLNPLALAFLIKSGQAPDDKLIEQAKQLIQNAVIPPQGMQMPGQVQPQGGLPMLPQGAPPGPPPPVPQDMHGGPPPVNSPTPQPPPPGLGEAHKEWAAMPKINQRSESGGKQ